MMSRDDDEKSQSSQSSIVPNISATLNAKVVALESDQTDPHRISKLYDTMADTFLQNGLNLDAVASQSLYYNGAMPLEYTAFPTPLPDAAVRLCLIFFEKVHQDGRKGGESIAGDCKRIAGHATRVRVGGEIQTMKDIVAQHKSPVFRVHRIVLADSGTLLLCLVEISPHSSVFHMRKAFRKAFPGSPPKQSTIYHASLGRIVTPEQLSEEKRREIHDMCEAWTRQLQGHEFTVDELFHVREVQFKTVRDRVYPYHYKHLYKSI
eukprot:jgi/Picre1/30639/NNA_006000.t1